MVGIRCPVRQNGDFPAHHLLRTPVGTVNTIAAAATGAIYISLILIHDFLLSTQSHGIVIRLLTIFTARRSKRLMITMKIMTANILSKEYAFFTRVV